MSHDPLAGLYFLLVGHQWPGLGALAALEAASARRAGSSADQETYAETLRAIRSSHLAVQAGITAEDTDRAFESGQSHAAEISAKNRAKAAAYEAAHQSTSQLRRDLADIAQRGDSAVRRVLGSSAPLPHKVNSIVEIIVTAQGHANAKAAEQAGNLFGTVQKVLDAERTETSARRFAEENGAALDRAFRLGSVEHVRVAVRDMVAKLPESAAEPTDAPAEIASSLNSAVAHDVDPGLATNASDSAQSELTSGYSRIADQLDVPAAPDAARPVTGPTAQIPAAGSVLSEPISDPGAGNHPDGPATATTGAPLGETVPASPAPTDPAFGRPTETTQPSAAAGVVSPPMRAAVGPTITAAAQGPLSAYGADLKPPVPAAPAVPSMAPAAPGSAPVIPAGGTAPAGQPTVLRQQRPTATAQAATTGLTERALVDTTGGAVPTRRQAENRLRRQLAAVARQQPQLRWGIGDLDAGGTVLVTDLASGWIPPDIDIPRGVQLLQPGLRRDRLAALLEHTTVMETYEPGQYLSPGPPVETSIRARDTPAVEDLGWELSQATRWRDGLPRLAHTLARAVSAGTGLLDSEVELLREHLQAVAHTILIRYPEQADDNLIGNWQLLATIDALIDGEKTSANYHFAWFRAHARMKGSTDER